MTRPVPRDISALDDALSEPSDGLVQLFRELDGDLVILGAGGKMGPSLAMMARRAMSLADGGERRSVVAVSRWSNEAVAHALDAAGVIVKHADLRHQSSVESLPYARNVIFMAGQKFGSGGDPASTWMMNTVVPVWCGDRYAGARQVVFSTGNVYPLSPATGPGVNESTPPAPVGEYAMSCLGRERVMTALGDMLTSPVALYRLNYACALTYGVLTDLAVKVRDGVPVDVTMGAVNVIWQRDANDIALRLLAHAATPAIAVNVTGIETLLVRTLATLLGERLGRTPVFTGIEAHDALLSDARALASRFPDLTPMPLTQLLDWTADWVGAGRPLLGKATKFEVRDGRF
ncbi:MAG TPA: hypothetical protein VE861_09865 [Gemmatimonadaceae bacterium]|nr:hypothetical protein [Gemmatimonadaceae bacterium]